VGEVRVGLGFDVHGWDETRVLRLGGIEVHGTPGLAGHSDGDVVCHAIADAVLGAAALGDLGEHLPDTDPATAGIAGGEVLRRIRALAVERGYSVSMADATIVAARPAIAPLRGAMRRAVAEHLGIAVEDVSIKATRPEGLGLTGEGIGCLAVVTMERR
jgi:2-C-methyl-D-erythritol 2,4-cyclodiphosphate synthase